MVAKEFTVDLNKPLVFQVGHLGEAYQQWVHQAIVTNEGPRFFESDFAEFFTRTPWWVIPVIWVPVSCWFISASVNTGRHTAGEISVLVMLGIIFMWTLFEYVTHRFLFHMDCSSYWTNTLHYFVHGYHHKHPMDTLRLVFPPAGTAVLFFPLWTLGRLIVPLPMAYALAGGVVLGYVMYDLTHYYLHHGHPTGHLSKNLKKYHLNHHFRITNKGFGVTSSVWDAVFGTVPTTKAADQKAK